MAIGFDKCKVACKLERDEHTEAEPTHLIPDELLQRFAFAGNPEVIKEQIDAHERSALTRSSSQFPGRPLCLARGSHLRSNASARNRLAPAGMS
jgi:hypothetical protein